MAVEKWENKYFEDDKGTIIPFDLNPVVVPSEDWIHVFMPTNKHWYVNSSPVGKKQLEAYKKYLNCETVEVVKENTCETCTFIQTHRDKEPCKSCVNGLYISSISNNWTPKC